MAEMLRLCGLWKSTSKRGGAYLSGRLGSAKMMLFKNSQKRTDKDPDYFVCLVPWEFQQQGQASGAQNAQRDDDDVPF
jgi:hypothetical protein